MLYLLWNIVKWAPQEEHVSEHIQNLIFPGHFYHSSYNIKEYFDVSHIWIKPSNFTGNSFTGFTGEFWKNLPVKTGKR